MKTGVEGAIEQLGVTMEEIFTNMTERLLEGIDTIVNGTNTKLDTIKKKDPVEITNQPKKTLSKTWGLFNQTSILYAVKL